MKKIRNNLEFYGFRESSGFVPMYVPKQPASGVFVLISKEEGNIITIGKDGGILAKLGLEIENSKLSLVNTATGFKLSTVEIPYINAVVDLSFETSENLLYLLVTKNNGLPPQRIEVPLGNVIKAYTAGNGIDITDNAISVRLAENGGIKFYADQGNAIGIDDDYVANQDELEDVIEDVHTISSKTEDMNDDIDELYEITSGLSDSIVNAFSAITGIDDRVDDLEEKVEELMPGGDITELEDKVDDLSGITNALSNALDSLVSDVFDISGKCDYNADEIERLDEEKLDVTAYTPYDDSELREKISQKLDITAYTPYDDSELRDLIDDKLDVSAYTPYDDSEIRDLIDEKLDASAYTPYDDSELRDLIDEKADKTDLNDYVTVQVFNDDQTRQDNAINGKASIGQLQELSDKVDSMPTSADLDAISSALENKADLTALTEVEESLDNFVTYPEYTSGQTEQNNAIREKANKSEVKLLNDKLGALVDLNNIVSGETSWEYVEPTSLSEAIRVIDHVQYLVHAMERDVPVSTGSQPFDENTCDSLLTKLMMLLDGFTGDDIIEINRKLKLMIE